MTTTSAWRRYLTFWRAPIDQDVDDELRFHTNMRIKEYMARGMTEADARRAVAERLGDIGAARAECVGLGHERVRHARNADLLGSLGADVAYALRSLARAPGWTAVALLTIALGVGATTAVFSVADTLLVRPFPYPNASRVFMARRETTIDGHTIPVSLPAGIVAEWLAGARSIEAAASFASAGATKLADGSDTVDVHVARIDTSFFAFAGAHPLRGRTFTSDDSRGEQPTVILLGEALWRRQFGASNDVIGKTVALEGRPRTIVGVVPASVTVPDFRAERADIFLPTIPRGPVVVLVRLKPGAAKSVATQELGTILEHANLFDIRPFPNPTPLHLTRPEDWLAIRQPLGMLVGAVALLLLVACTNVAHLLLARGASRQRELAVRHALGAGRARLVRQLVTESAVVAIIGGALAMSVGWVILRVLAAVRPPTLIALSYVSTNRGVLMIASSLAILCGLAVGLLAALRTAHRDLAASLRIGAASGIRSAHRLRSSLVVAEVALSATLLVGALLLIHAVFDLQHADLGFDARGLYAVSFPRGSDTTVAARAAFAAFLRERATSLPGVRGVTIGTAPGPRGWQMVANYEVPGREAAPDAASGSTRINFVAPDYFRMMSIPFVAGHSFDDGSFARNEVIVSRSLARLIAPADSAIGRRFRNAVPRSRGVIEPWQTVIGVVPDVMSSLVDGDARPVLYNASGAGTNGLGGTDGGATVLVRLESRDPTALLKQFVASVRPGPRASIVNVRDQIDESLSEPRFTMRILTGFALLGVVLAAIGLFGVISYGVGQRTREIGVRMTLGATRGSIARLVVGDGIRLTLAGIGIGMLGTTAATRLIQNLLYGVSRLDAFSFAVGAVTLLVVSFFACLVPMLRATGVDPVVAIRVE